MRTYEVTINKPSKYRDWCLYDNIETLVHLPTSTAILTARDVDALHEKIEKHYAGFEVLRIREVHL